jgi:hypothetical protein
VALDTLPSDTRTVFFSVLPGDNGEYPEVGHEFGFKSLSTPPKAIISYGGTCDI